MRDQCSSPQPPIGATLSRVNLCPSRSTCLETCSSVCGAPRDASRCVRPGSPLRFPMECRCSFIPVSPSARIRFRLAWGVGAVQGHRDQRESKPGQKSRQNRRTTDRGRHRDRHHLGMAAMRPSALCRYSLPACGPWSGHALAAEFRAPVRSPSPRVPPALAVESWPGRILARRGARTLR